MSSPDGTPATSLIYRWHEGALHQLDYCDMAETSIVVADSWFVGEGKALALALHRARFFAAIPEGIAAELDAEGFWDAAIAAIPRTGEWFPRVELQARSGAHLLVFRLRNAPERGRSVVVASNPGADPRRHPTVKGPDLESMLRIRTLVQARGAEEAIVLTDDGFVVEGAYSGLLWWRGEILCAPSEELERVDSVTAKSVLGLAAALGVDIAHETVTPSELDGVELWALSALHGIRIVTRWVDGPALAEKPGRLALWRDKLAALARPLPTV